MARGRCCCCSQLHMSSLDHSTPCSLHNSMLQNGRSDSDGVSQIFKHHISLIEGHLKMTDMVRKHTVEGTGNPQPICAIIDRAKEMLRASRHISRILVGRFQSSRSTRRLRVTGRAAQCAQQGPRRILFRLDVPWLFACRPHLWQSG